MLEWERLVVDNYLLWRNADLKFDEGITLIRGPNRAGKSTLFQALHQAHWGSESAKRGTSGSKQPPKSIVTIDAKEGGHSWKLISKPGKVSVLKDGKDQETKGVGGRKLVQDLLPIPKSLFDATIHLQSGKEDPLTTGTPGSRLAWMSEVLGVTEVFDKLYEKAEVLHSKYFRAAETLSLIEEELENLDLTKPKYSSVKIRTKLEQVNKLVDKQRQALLSHSQYVELSSNLQVDDNLSELKASLKKLVKELAKQEQQHEAYLHYAQTAERIDDLENRLAVIDKKLSKLDVQVEEKHSLQVAGILNQIYSDAQEKKRQWDDQARYRRQAKTIAESIKEKDLGLSLKKAEQQKHYHQANIKSRKLLLDGFSSHSKHSDDHNCPICRSSLTSKASKNIASQFKKDITKSNSTIKRMDKVIEYHELCERITITNKPDASTSKFLLKQARIMANTASQVSKLKTQRKSLVKDLAKLGKVKKIKPTDRKAMSRMQREIEDIRGRIRSLESIDKLGLKQLPAFKVKQFKQEFKQLSEKAEKLSEMLPKAMTQETMYEQNVRQHKLLSNRAEKLKNKAKKVRIFEELKRALGKTGQRRIVVKRKVEWLTQEINRLVPLIWNEPLQFEFEVKHDGLTVYATRDNMRSDITQLSGSEAKSWRLMLALALLRILPDKYRGDTIILDEMESNMQHEVRSRVLNEFVPELQKTVPKVVWVTPLSIKELNIVPDRMYEIIKTNGKSKLVQVK